MIYQMTVYYGALINGKVIYSSKTELVDAKKIPTKIDERVFKDNIVMQIEKDGFDAKNFDFSFLTKEQYENRDKNERKTEFIIERDGEEKSSEDKSIEYLIKTFKNEEGIFAEIVNEKGDNICTGDGETELEAIKEVCLVFSDILDDIHERILSKKLKANDAINKTSIKDL